MPSRSEVQTGRRGWRFVPAPQWPSPPPGWTPPLGWQPDPSWPTPPGWRWIRRTQANALAVAVACVGAGAFGAVLLVVSIIAVATGHSIDPTDPANVNRYSIRNDSSGSLYTNRCSDRRCATLSGGGWDLVKPGAAVAVSLDWGDSAPVVWAVSVTPSAESDRLCLRIDVHTKAADVVTVLLSSAATC